MLRAFQLFILLLVVLLASEIGYSLFTVSSDGYLRERVVKLFSEKGSCTGVQIEAPSHKIYTLTAGHCKPLIIDGKIMAEDEHGRVSVLEFVVESRSADLLLLKGGYPMSKAIEVADKAFKHQKVHTMTRGGGAASYRTDGELVDRVLIRIPEYEINSVEDLEKCTKDLKHTSIESIFGYLCVLTEYVERTTAHVIPGSSGGPLVDDDNKLVGIASATDGMFGYFVSLQDIKDFLADK